MLDWLVSSAGKLGIFSWDGSPFREPDPFSAISRLEYLCPMNVFVCVEATSLNAQPLAPQPFRHRHPLSDPPTPKPSFPQNQCQKLASTLINEFSEGLFLSLSVAKPTTTTATTKKAISPPSPSASAILISAQETF